MVLPKSNYWVVILVGLAPATSLRETEEQRVRKPGSCEDVGTGGGRGGLPPAACHYLPHLCRGPWKKNGVRKIPLAPFYPPCFCPRQARDQRNVDSMSTSVRGAARGLLYGQEQMAVAQVDLRLASAVARPPYHYPQPPPPGERLLKNSSWCSLGFPRSTLE